MINKSNKASMRVKIRKVLPSYVVVTRIIRPKKGGGYRRNKDWRKEVD